MLDLPDDVLARRAGMGDQAAFTAIFRRHGPATHRYARTMLDGNTADVEDALQNAWTKVWLNIDGFRSASQLRTWIFTIVGREVHTLRRRSRPLLVDDDLLTTAADRPERQPEHEVGSLGLADALTLALSELPWRQRASWVLREVDGLTYDEIAVVLDTSPTVVRGQLHRARRALATRLEQWR